MVPSTSSSSPPTGTPWAIRVHDNTGLACQIGNVECGGIPFDGGIGCQDQLIQWLLLQTLLQQIQPQFTGAYAIQWRQVPHQHKVTTGIEMGLLQGRHIGRRFDHAQLTLFGTL